LQIWYFCLWIFRATSNDLGPMPYSNGIGTYVFRHHSSKSNYCAFTYFYSF
jgi:hypothetical protein